MPQRTVSIPQIQGIAARDSAMHEILTRLRDAVNTALTLPAANGVPVKAKSSITLSNPVTRVIGPGTVHTIEGGDFGVPVWIIATGEDVGLATGGNIASGATVRAGYAVALIFDSKTGLFWPSKHTVYAEDVIGLGTAATRDVPAAGNAAADEVVLGSDTRLTGGSPLTVEESDGTPSVANVTEIRFSGATVTDNGAGAVTVTVASGGAASPASSLYLYLTAGGF